MKPALRDVAERNALVEKWLRLPWYVMRKARFRWLTRDEALSAGYAGLIRAAELWEPERGSFARYAYIWIRQAIQAANHKAYRAPRPTCIVYGIADPISEDRALDAWDRVAKLRTADRVLLEERFVLGWTTRRMAEARGVSKQYVSKRLRRILEVLREKMQVVR